MYFVSHLLKLDVKRIKAKLCYQ